MSEQQKDVVTPDAADTTMKSEAAERVKFDLDQARAGLAKLPILGPALWLYGRDPYRKFSFIADMDWLLLPPVILDQCRLYTKNGIPTAFVTWALVSDAVDARLRSGVPRIAPHEWKSGPHLWLIDIVSPFGAADETLADLLQGTLAGHAAHAVLPDPAQGGALTVRSWPARMPADNAKH